MTNHNEKLNDTFESTTMQNTKTCPKCKVKKDALEFHKSTWRNDGLSYWCKECDRNYKGNKPVSKNKECSSYLGFFIAESVLSTIFKSTKRMPYGNKGFDFVCSNGFKIDVKRACLKPVGYDLKYGWRFGIKRNKVADYFLLLAFDNRDNLVPQHIWLIKGNEIVGNPPSVLNNHAGFTVLEPKNFTKYSQTNELSKVKEICLQFNNKQQRERND